jgi:predicted DsbA family dithiol-disulfide isomerase
MVERLFRAYFTEGRNVGDHATLAALAAEVGLAAEDAERTLATGEFAADVRRDVDEALQLGINGVPFFVFGGRYAVSGAQDVEVFLDVLRRTGG